MIMFFLEQFLFKLLSSFWNWLVASAYWLTVIMSDLCIIYYAATGSKKFMRTMWVAIITYILIKGVDMVL